MTRPTHHSRADGAPRSPPPIPPRPSQRSEDCELFFVAETNPETPPDPPPQPSLYLPNQAPPFTVQLFMWALPARLSLEEVRLSLG